MSIIVIKSLEGSFLFVINKIKIGGKNYGKEI